MGVRRRHIEAAKALPGGPDSMKPGSPWGPLEDLFQHVPLDDRAKNELYAQMSAPSRLYHGVGHLELLWRRNVKYRERAGLTDPEIQTLLACAIAFHDSVYDPLKIDNEDRSADYWLRASEGSRMCEEDRAWVADTIRVTRDHLAYDPGPPPADPRALKRERARLWMLDLDLTPLGEKPPVFAANTRLLRAEARSKSDAKWIDGLRMFHQHFLSAPCIYRSPALAKLFEAQARRNLAIDPAEASSALDKPQLIENKTNG